MSKIGNVQYSIKQLFLARKLWRAMVIAPIVVVLIATTVFIPEPVKAGTGGRFTFRNDNNTTWGVDFYGAGLGEIPFVIDTNGDKKQELAVYYNNRITVRTDNGGY